MLGVDVGEVRIGLALSDPTGSIVTPLKALDARGAPHDQERIASIASEHEAATIVVGLPISMDGTVGSMARKVQAFCRLLRELTDLPVQTIDERLTTAEAEMRLRAAGVQPSRDKGRLDSAAAAIILESYLASHAE